MSKTKERVCEACNISKAYKYFNNVKAKVCSLCESKGAQPAVTQRDDEIFPTATDLTLDGAPSTEFPASEINYTSPTTQEMAARILARRSLIPFVKRFRPKYTAGWVHEDIARRLVRFMEAVERGEEPRLLMMLPPRAGKSELGSRNFVPFVLGHHPDWEIIAASHTNSLTLSFSRYIRDLLRDPSYHALFPNTRLDPSSQSVENWNLTGGGGYLAAGVGTGITGRGCFIAGTQIYSDVGLLTIADLVRLYKTGRAPRVLSYNHDTNTSEYRDVIAAYEETTDELIELTYANGRKIHCTPNHTVYTEDRGYIAAEILSAGDTVYITNDLPSVSTAEESGFQSMPGVLRHYTTEHGSAYVYELSETISTHTVRGGEISQAWPQRSLLFGGLLESAPRHKKRQAVFSLFAAGVRAWRESKLKILFFDLSSSGTPSKTNDHLSGVFGDSDAPKSNTHILLEGLRKLCSLAKNAWRGKLELCRWAGLPGYIFQNAAVNFKTRQTPVCGLQQQKRSAGASYRRSEDERRAGEFSNTVSGLPHHPPQISSSTVALVKRICCKSVGVYDIQVEGHSNYFAESLLVHNCHILLLDDLVKDIEAADSQPQRDSVWEWYASTAYTRLAPGGGVLGILTWWNEDDWAGRIQQTMNAADGGDTFEIIRYPAINDEGDEYLLPNDQIVQLPEGSDIPEGARMTRPMGTAIHPERYSTAAMTRIKRNLEASGQKRIWSALYQQNPTPDEGIYFSKTMFKDYQHELSRMGVQIYQAWDFAITEGTQNDWTVGITVLQDAYDDLYVLDVNRFRSGDGENIMNIVVQYAIDWNVNLLGVEDGQIWKALESTFTRICAAKKFYPAYEKLKPLTDKLVRAQPLKGRMQASKVFFPTRAPWYTALKNELLRFPAGKHDDQVDALAWVVRLILTKSAPQLAKPKAVKSWRDKLRQLEAGGRGGAMAA